MPAVTLMATVLILANDTMEIRTVCSVVVTKCGHLMYNPDSQKSELNTKTRKKNYCYERARQGYYIF